MPELHGMPKTWDERKRDALPGDIIPWMLNRYVLIVLSRGERTIHVLLQDGIVPLPADRRRT